MSVSAQNPFVEYVGNGSTTTGYTISFDYQDSADIDVYVDGEAYSTFTITGGKVYTTTAIASSSEVRIEMGVALAQTATLVSGGDLDSTVVERVWDRLTYIAQQLNMQISRCLRMKPGGTPAAAADTTSKYPHIDGSGDLEWYSAAQVAADVNSELNLSDAISDKVTATTADAAGRAALAPAFTGQILVQLDTNELFVGTGTSAGNWQRERGPIRTFANKAALTAATPNYIGELAQITRGGSWYRAYGATSADWDWVSFGTFTPPSSTSWATSTAYEIGDLVKVTGGDRVYECTADHTSGTFATDRDTNGYWITYLVEDYHYTMRDPRTGHAATKEAWLGPASRADDWGSIVDEVYQLFPTVGGGSGISSLWGAEYVVAGTIHFTEGSYLTDTPIKHVPGCMLTGPADANSNTQPVAIKASTNWNASNKYLVQGVFRDGSGSGTNFNTSLCHMLLDCNRQADRGAYLSMSLESRVVNVRVERADDTGFHIAQNSDDFVMRDCHVLARLDDGTTTNGLWLDSRIRSARFECVSTAHCDVGISLGLSYGNEFLVEFENTGLPIEYRANNHADINGSGTSSAGAPHGDRWLIVARRNSDDDYVTSTRVLAHVRVKADAYDFTMLGLVEDAGSGTPNQPYDRIQWQVNTGTVYTYPLKFARGYDLTDADQQSFEINGEYYWVNDRFRSDNTQMVDDLDNTNDILVAADNPTRKTGAVTESVTLDWGIYRIRIPAGNTYGTDYTITVNQAASGDPVPGMNAYSTAAALTRYWFHPGGDMEIVVAGTTGSPSIDVYFTPWKE